MQTLIHTLLILIKRYLHNLLFIDMVLFSGLDTYIRTSTQQVSFFLDIKMLMGQKRVKHIQKRDAIITYHFGC